MAPYLWCLCIRTVEKDIWGNFGDSKICPWGAGLCVRGQVGRRYIEKASQSTLHIFLDRRGGELGSAGDLDLATTSYELGLGTGLFQGLHVTHLIPQRRLNIGYLLNLISDSEASHMVFSHLHGQLLSQPASRIDRLVAFYKRLRANPLQKQVERAREKGRLKAQEIISRNDAKSF
jgi:hypothetical protein